MENTLALLLVLYSKSQKSYKYENNLFHCTVYKIATNSSLDASENNLLRKASKISMITPTYLLLN